MNKDLELKVKIKRTKFRFTGTVEDRKRKDSTGNTVYIPQYVNDGFVIFYDRLLDKIYNNTIKITQTELRVLIWFAKHIEFNSNWIKATQREIAFTIGLDVMQVNKALHSLEDINMIDVRSHSEYIINHNYIFRGNMLQFYEDYKRLYPDQKGEIF